MIYILIRLGIQYVKPIGDCAITEEEFKTICSIFKGKRANIELQ